MALNTFPAPDPWPFEPKVYLYVEGMGSHPKNVIGKRNRSKNDRERSGSKKLAERIAGNVKKTREGERVRKLTRLHENESNNGPQLVDKTGITRDIRIAKWPFKAASWKYSEFTYPIL
ncbi:hypothetical protein TWF281_000376 [Arthrobotrys megalospora]